MAVFLTVHARYKDVQWGIFRDADLIQAGTDDSKKVSKNFLPMLDSLLKKNKLAFSELSFIVAHQGPAPFTTLRVCLATVNGFNFATGIPLVGINGLETLIDQYKQQQTITVVLLNAFSHEVYYALHDPASDTIQYGCAQAESYITQLAQTSTGTVTFLGNGVTLYAQTIKTAFGERAHYEPRELISLERVAEQGLTKWGKRQISTQLLPVYLKGYSTPPAPHKKLD